METLPHATRSRHGQSSVTPLIALFLMIAFSLGGLIFGWVWPAIREARAQAAISQSHGNLKVIGLALHNYHDTYGELPPPYIADKNGKPMHSWRVLILPFLEHGDLYSRYDFEEPWDGPNNRLLFVERPRVYSSPRIYGENPITTTYQAIAGPGTCFDPAVPNMRFGDIADGMDITALIVEDFGKSVVWTQPADISPQEFLSGMTLKAAPDDKAWVMNADTSVKLIQRPDLNATAPWMTRDAGD